MILTDPQFRILYIICLGEGNSIAYSRHQRTFKALVRLRLITPSLQPMQATLAGYRAACFVPVIPHEPQDQLDTDPLSWTTSPKFPWFRLI